MRSAPRKSSPAGKDAVGNPPAAPRLFVHARVVLHRAGTQRVCPDRSRSSIRSREVADDFDLADFGRRRDCASAWPAVSLVDFRNVEGRQLPRPCPLTTTRISHTFLLTWRVALGVGCFIAPPPRPLARLGVLRLRSGKSQPPYRSRNASSSRLPTARHCQVQDRTSWRQPPTILRPQAGVI